MAGRRLGVHEKANKRLGKATGDRDCGGRWDGSRRTSRSHDDGGNARSSPGIGRFSRRQSRIGSRQNREKHMSVGGLDLRWTLLSKTKTLGYLEGDDFLIELFWS